MSTKEFSKRRKKLARAIGKNSVAILSTADLSTRTNDIYYPFRSDSDFYYYTGFSEPQALMMIARAADGSARDGLSILDQAISMAEGKVTADQVKSMLGLADQSHILDLFDAAVRGKTETALDILDDLYNAGAEPMVVMQDLLDISHILTRLNTAKDSTNLKGRFPESELKRAAELAQDLSLPALAKSWQILLAGHQDLSLIHI